MKPVMKILYSLTGSMNQIGQVMLTNFLFETILIEKETTEQVYLIKQIREVITNEFEISFDEIMAMRMN